MPFKDINKRKEYNRQRYLKTKCSHGLQKTRCVECDGRHICEHKRIKYQCVECEGSSICEHKRRKSRCVECEGSEICEHKRRKHQCIECDGNGICEHKHIKSRCVECEGSEICEHKCRKSFCVECDGRHICEHNRRIHQCVECEGSGICIHKRRKSYCVECKGSEICPHDHRKSQCRDCSPILYIIQLHRWSISRIMKQTNLDKTKPSIEYLGCSAEYFRDYIKSKMTEDMTFENIHYDHIKPVSVFNLEEENELLDCCHYTNFQPLLAKENLRKSCKWNDEDEVFWKENIRGKEYLPLYFPKG